MNSMSARPPNPRFRSCAGAGPFELPAHGDDLAGEGLRVDRRGQDVADRLGDLLAEAPGREDDPGAGQGQALPRVRLPPEVVGEGLERHHERAGRAVRPEPGVDRVQGAGRRRGRRAP